MTLIGDAAVLVRLDLSDVANIKDKIGNALKNPLVDAAAAVTATSAVVADFSKKSIDKFKDLAGEVRGLTRATGQSAEDMSRLRFAAQETGVSTDALTLGIKKLSVDVSTNNKVLAENGIQIKNSKGQLLPLTDVLGNAAQKFASLPNGIEKNTLAIKVFGRSGTDLIPILNKGKDGLAELAKESDKYGLTLTGTNLAAIQKSASAHKELNAAMDGLQVQLGSKLFPILASVTEFFASKAVPVILDLTTLVDTKLGPVLTSVFKNVQSSFEALVNGFETGDSAAADGLHGLIGIAEDAGVTLKAVFSFVDDAYHSLLQGFKNPSAEVGPGISALEKAFVSVGAFVKTAFEGAKAAGQGFVDWVSGTLIPVVRPRFDALKSAVGTAFNALKDDFETVKSVIVVDVLPKLQDVADKLSAAVLPAVKDVADAFSGELGPALQGASLLGFATLAVSVADTLEAFKTLKEIAFVQVLIAALTIEVDAFTISMFGAEIAIGAFEIPALAVAAAIAAIAGGAVYAYTHFQAFRDVVDGVAKFFVDEVVPAIASAVLFAVEQFQHFADFVQKIWPQVKTVIEAALLPIAAAIGLAVETILFVWDNFGQEILRIGKFAFDLVSAVIKTAVAVLRDVILFDLDLITGRWREAFGDILRIAQDLFSGATKVVGDLVGIVGQEFKALGELVSLGFKKSAESAFATFETFVGYVGTFPGRLASAGRGLFDWIAKDFKSAINSVIDGLANLKISTPKVHIPGTNVDIESTTIGFPPIPHLAKGGFFDNIALVGENGPELVATNSMSSVFPMNQLAAAISGILSQSKTSAADGGNTYVLNNYGPTDAKSLMEQFQDMQRLAVPIR